MVQEELVEGKADDFKSLDVNLLKRRGWLRPGYGGRWRWTVDGEQAGYINLTAETSRLILECRYSRMVAIG